VWTGFNGKHPRTSEAVAPLEQFKIPVYCIANELLIEPQNLFSLKLGFGLTEMDIQKWEGGCGKGMKRSG